MTTPSQQAETTAPADSGGTTAPAATQPQAQGAPAAGDVASLAQQVKDAVFAELRRSGALGAPKPKPAASAPADQQAPPVDLRRLDRALMRTGAGQKLSDAAIQRIERAFQAEAPDDADVWVAEYLGGFGVAAPATTNHTASTSAAAAAVRTGPPVSDGGAPPVARVPLEDQDILRMSESDRVALRKQIGDAKFVQRFMEQQKGKTFRVG